MSDRIEIKLSESVQHMGDETDTLYLRRDVRVPDFFRGREIMERVGGFMKGSESDLLGLAIVAAGMNSDVVKQLHVRDMGQLIDAAADLVSSDPKAQASGSS